METRLTNVVAARKAQLADAKARTLLAEAASKELTTKLKEKDKEILRLQTRVELVKRYNETAKELVIVYQKLDEAKKKLQNFEERSKKAESIVETFLSQSDSFESKYRETKKKHTDLLHDLEGLALN